MTKKELLEAIKDMPDDARVIPHEKPFDSTLDTIAMVGYDAERNEISLFDYYNYTLC